jgi:hypothetical protein
MDMPPKKGVRNNPILVDGSPEFFGILFLLSKTHIPGDRVFFLNCGDEKYPILFYVPLCRGSGQVVLELGDSGVVTRTNECTDWRIKSTPGIGGSRR